MGLSKKQLATDLESFFFKISERKEALSSPECATELFEIYLRYARKAEDPSGDLPLLLNTTGAKTALIGSFANQKAEEGFKSCMGLLWTGATFNVIRPALTMSQETSSVVTRFSLNKLDGVFSDTYLTPKEASNNLAAKLHAFTLSISVLITGLAKAGSPPPVVTFTGTVS